MHRASEGRASQGASSIPPMVRHPRAVGLVALLVTGLAVSTGAGAVGVTGTDTTEPTETTEASATTDTTPSSLPSFEPAPIEWTSIGEQLEEGRLEVPIDYANPDAGTFSLYLVRHLANNPDERIGSLLVNPGGPGISGTVLAEQAELIYGDQLLDSFDIVAWDPRGIGHDRAGDRLRRRLRPVLRRQRHHPGRRGRAAADHRPRRGLRHRSAWRTTATSSSSSAPTTPPATSTRIRRALGEDEISCFGFSYGSELGATWATLFPDTVRAAVLDGAADPNADELDARRCNRRPGSRPRWRRSSPNAAPIPTARSTTTVTPRARSTS